MRVRTLFFVLMGLIFGWSCSHISKTSQREPNQQADVRAPIHLIITVHGLRGNSKSFGYMPEALVQQMKDVQPQYNLQVMKFEYLTGDKKLSTFDFAKNLSTAIDTFFVNNGGLIEQDKISLITHSQGGLVSIIWYIDNLLARSTADSISFSDTQLSQYARRIDAVISLGSPFWGSKLAAGSQSDNAVINWAGKQLPYGFTELKEMSFSSNTIFKFRRRAIAIDKIPDSEKYIKARFLNIAGIVPDKISKQTAAKIDSSATKLWMQMSTNFLQTVGFGGEQYESDTAVIIPSARLDFIYGEALNKDYQADEVLEFKSFQQTKYMQDTDIPFILVRAVHTSPNIKNFYDVVEIPKFCVTPSLCDHPTYKFVIKHLLNCETEAGTAQCDQDKYKKLMAELDLGNSRTLQNSVNNIKPLQGFALDINLRLPLDYVLDKKFLVDHIGFLQALDMNFEKKPFSVLRSGRITRDDSNVPYDIYLGRSNEIYSSTTTSAYNFQTKQLEPFAFFDQTLNPLRFHITGIVQPRIPQPINTSDYEFWKENGFPIKIRIHLPGLKPRIVIARVKPSYSTFIDVVLER